MVARGQLVMGIATDSETDRVTIRQPSIDDGLRVYGFIRECGTLEVNSAYLYFLLGSHFSATCAVAEARGSILGFLGGYLIPARPDTYFVWQIGVSGAARGKGLAGRMIGSVLRREACARVRFLEATVSPDNDASNALFRGIASRFGADHMTNPFISKEMFGQLNHDAENLHRIGPILTNPKGAPT